MPTATLSKEVWKKRKAQIEEALRKGYPPPGSHGKHGMGAIRMAATSLGISPTSLQSSIARAKELKYPQPNWSLYKDSEAAQIEAKTPDSVRTKNQIEALRKQLNDALEYATKLEDVRTTAFQLKPENLTVPQWQVKTSKKLADRTPEIPTLFTSDFQCGEVIRPEELDYPNAYSPEIFQERYRRLIRVAVKLLERENSKMDYPGFVYLRGGDCISGSIHPDLAETQSITPVEQAKLVAQEEIRGLEELLKAVPKVTVYSVPGNHDRTTFKPRAKRYVEHSFDDLIVFAMQKHFQTLGENRIQFIAPRSGDAFFSIYETNYLLTHGDRIGSRGGAGFIGAASPLSKGIHKVRQQAAHVGKKVDYVLTGHFHVAMALPHGIANGCLAGFSEYAKNELRAEPEPPTQTMFWTDPKWGLTTIRRLRVDHD